MKTILILIVAVILSSPAFAEDVNYCKNKESWKEWEALVQKYPHNMNIQMLHAVRIGFCKKIEDGSITFEMARDAFNKLHEIALQKVKKEQSQWLKNQRL